MSSRSPAIPIAVMASGRGSNFEAILTAVQRGELAAEIVTLISDQKDSIALQKARSAGVPALHVPIPAPKASPDAAERRRLHEEAILQALQSCPRYPHFLVMAGYMRIVTPYLIEAFRSPRGYSRIVNIHPSILPAFPGINAYAQAFQHGSKVTGATVHLVEDDVDGGPICAQEVFSISDCGTAEEVERRGLEIEHRLYPRTLSWILPEKFEVLPNLLKRRLSVRPN